MSDFKPNLSGAKLPSKQTEFAIHIETRVRNWMINNKDEYDNSTNLAEAAAEEFNTYEDEIEYKIPEWVFEVSGDIMYPDDNEDEDEDY